MNPTPSPQSVKFGWILYDRGSFWEKKLGPLSDHEKLNRLFSKRAQNTAVEKEETP